MRRSMPSRRGRLATRLWSPILLLVVAAVALLPAVARAEDGPNIVRVGWYESAFNRTDELGRRSGYAYDYQQKIAPYTGWTYEYVEGSWPELLQMLKDGRIDLLSDVSYTEERAQQMLFSSLPMGAEEYYLYATPGNHDVSPEDISTFQGKRIGANKGSVQIGTFREWAKANGVEAEVVEMTGTEEANLKALARGKIDLYLSLGGLFDKGSVMPVCRVGVSDFYFAVSASRPELLVELNNAMNRIQEENQYYNQQLYAKYLQTSSVNNYLNATEREWLEAHGAIRVGYQDNYLAFCAKDPDTGELTGALRDWLDAASDNVENADLRFEPVCYPTAAAAMEAMQGGEVDCVFPSNLTDYDGEMGGVFVTPALMRTDMSAIVRAEDQRSFASKDRVAVAVNADNPNYDMFLLDHFPSWRAIYFADTQACLEAVAEGQADCLLISNYRYNNIASTCEKLRLVTWSTGVELDFCFAVNRDDPVLYSILSKATAVVPQSTVNAALAYYFTEDARSSTLSSVSQVLWGIAAGVLVVAALAMLFLLARNAWADRKGTRHQPAPLTRESFALFDELPVSYSAYHVTKAEHSKLYDAEIIYANHIFGHIGGKSADEVIGHSVRELYPYVGEDWFEDARRAAFDGEAVERSYADPLSGRTFRLMIRQLAPGYCAAVYL